MTIKTKIAKAAISGSIWLIISKIVYTLIRIGITVILARLLTPSDFGIAAVVILIIESSKTFSFTFINKNIILNDYSDGLLSNALYLSIVIASIVSIMLTVLAVPLANVLNTSQIIELLPIFCWVLLVSSLSNIYNSFLSKEINFKVIAIRSIISNIFGTGGLAVLLGYLGYGYYSLLCGGVLTELLNMILTIRFVKIKFKPIDLSLLKILTKDYWSISFTSLINNFALNGDNFIISRYLGLSELGFYTKGYQLMSMPTVLLGNILSKVGFSALVKKQSDINYQKDTFFRVMYLVAMTLLPFSVVLYYVSNDIIKLILGTGWEQTTKVFQILVFGLFFRFAYKIPATLIQVQAKFNILMLIQVIYALNVLVFSFSLKDLGIVGVASGVLGSLIIQFVIMSSVFLYNIHIGIKEVILFLIRPISLTILLVFIVELGYDLLGKGLWTNWLIPLLSYVIMFIGMIFSKNNILLGQYGLWWKTKIRLYAN